MCEAPRGSKARARQVCMSRFASLAGAGVGVEEAGEEAESINQRVVFPCKVSV